MNVEKPSWYRFSKERQIYRKVQSIEQWSPTIRSRTITNHRPSIRPRNNYIFALYLLFESEQAFMLENDRVLLDTLDHLRGKGRTHKLAKCAINGRLSIDKM